MSRQDKENGEYYEVQNYLRPETKARLERVLLERKLSGEGGAADQSEAIEEALQVWLQHQEGKG